jgi:hypothetical protein
MAGMGRGALAVALGLVASIFVGNSSAAGAPNQAEESFCAPEAISALSRPLSRLPLERPIPDDGKVAFGLRAFEVRGLGAVGDGLLSGVDRFGYEFRLLEGATPRQHWRVSLTGHAVSRKGTVLRGLGTKRRHIGLIGPFDRRRLLLSVPTELGFYALDLVIRTSQGRLLGEFKEYFRVVRPRLEARVRLSSSSVSPGDTIAARIDNVGGVPVALPLSYAVEHWNGVTWQHIGPGSRPGPRRPGFLEELPAGSTNGCVTFGIPSTAASGQYRFSQVIRGITVYALERYSLWPEQRLYGRFEVDEGGEATQSSGVNDVADKGIAVTASLNARGGGVLWINGVGGAWAWEICARDLSICWPFARRGPKIETTGARPNSVFRATHKGMVGLSPIWLGRLRGLAAPSVRGVIRANRLVAPTAGRWEGGWEGEGGNLQLSACLTSAGNDCVSLTDPTFRGRCAHDAAVLDPVFAGWYLKVAEQRRGPGPFIVPRGAAGSPYEDTVWRAGPTVSVSVVGRIKRASSRRAVECGPLPLNRAVITESGAVTIKCAFGCRAVLTARNGQGRVRMVERVTRDQSVRAAEKGVDFAGAAREVLGLGATYMTVDIDGERVDERSVVIGEGPSVPPELPRPYSTWLRYRG